jgi:hypothetical protein
MDEISANWLENSIGGLLVISRPLQVEGYLPPN